MRDGKVVRWISEQMPFQVFVARGLTLDNCLDRGVPRMNVDNTSGWPDLVMEIVRNPEQFKALPVAAGYTDAQYSAAVQGIGMWKPFEKEGLFSYVLTDDPSEADVYVFWTNHFVNKLGLFTFSQDIRGLTAKYMLPLGPCLANPEAAARSMKPVVIYLRTVQPDGTPVPFDTMRSRAAHEFGHALGIDGHSRNPADLMSVYYGRGVVSPGDAATIRQLYRLTPDLIP
jgi:hypothetical protein